MIVNDCFIGLNTTIELLNNLTATVRGLRSSGMLLQSSLNNISTSIDDIMEECMNVSITCDGLPDPTIFQAGANFSLVSYITLTYDNVNTSPTPLTHPFPPLSHTPFPLLSHTPSYLSHTSLPTPLTHPFPPLSHTPSHPSHTSIPTPLTHPFPPLSHIPSHTLVTYLQVPDVESELNTARSAIGQIDLTTAVNDGRSLFADTRQEIESTVSTQLNGKTDLTADIDQQTSKTLTSRPARL